MKAITDNFDKMINNLNEIRKAFDFLEDSKMNNKELFEQRLNRLLDAVKFKKKVNRIPFFSKNYHFYMIGFCIEKEINYGDFWNECENIYELYCKRIREIKSDPQTEKNIKTDNKFFNNF
jgi:hypothetical protein